MNNVMKSTYSVVIFYVLSNNIVSSENTSNYGGNKKDCTVFDVLVGTNSGRLKKVKSDLYDKQLDVIYFSNQPIVVLLKYGNDLLLAIGNNDQGKDSRVLRCPFNWHKLAIKDKESCWANPIYTVEASDRYVTSMVIVKSTLFIGHHDGTIVTCSLEGKPECSIKVQTDKDLTGMAYDSKTNQIYVSSSSGSLNRLDVPTLHFSKVKEYDHGLTAVHVAYDAVWVSTSDRLLLKCPLVEGQLDCQQFDKISWSKSTIQNFAARKGYLYAYFSNAKTTGRTEMWRCDPEFPENCYTTLTLYPDVTSFLISD